MHEPNCLAHLQHRRESLRHSQCRTLHLNTEKFQMKDLLVQHHPPTVQSTAGFAGTTPPSHSAINGRICWYNTTLPQCNQRQDLRVQHHPPTVQSTAGFAGTTPPSHSAINGRETKIWSGKTTCSTLVTQTVRTRTVTSRNDKKRATLPG